MWLAGMQGEMADRMYFVAEGVVRIVDPDSGKLLTTMAKGSYFGEFALLQVGPGRRLCTAPHPPTRRVPWPPFPCSTGFGVHGLVE
jgi:CRP-like cAMP-binding protein